MTPAQIIVLATPVFLALIALEAVAGWRRRQPTYRLNDALASIGLGMLSQVAGLFTAIFTLGLYTWVHGHWAWLALPVGSPWAWLAALVLYDLCYYWHHRCGHRVALFWAAHVVHHQSEEYNFSTALRQTASGWLAGWVFYLPMALLGFPPLMFATVALVDLLYQYWVHTRLIGRLGWFDRWFCSPSNHRVHHAVNDAYLDRNYGGILIAWDRLFGSFREEDDATPCVYGTRSPLRSWNPLWANLEVYAALAKDCWHTRRWSDKLRVWFKPPGWRPADVASKFPRAPFEIERAPYHPRVGAAAQAGALVLFAVALVLTAGLLWQAHALSLGQQALAALAIAALLTAMGTLLAGRRAPTTATAARTAPATLQQNGPH